MKSDSGVERGATMGLGVLDYLDMLSGPIIVALVVCIVLLIV
jgi:hypothetical protein